MIKESFLNDALNIYRYGSMVYGTYQPGVSDEDFIVIVPDGYCDDDTQFEMEDKQYTLYTKSTWLRKLEDNEPCAVECAYLPHELIVKQEETFPFVLDISKIRSQFSAKASNSWVKCKKKLTVEKDFAPRIGKKSLWHSMRLLMYGIQLLKCGRIYDYGCANHLYNEIVNAETNDWNYFKERYQPMYNNLKSEFRNLEHEIEEDAR